MSETSNSLVVAASIEKVFTAFTTPDALETWMAPGDMKAQISNFDLRVGGGYTMTLLYPPDEHAMQGKSSAKEDRYSSTFLELITNKRIIEAINFDTTDLNFRGEMIMTIDLLPVDGGTKVTISFRDIPKGIKPSDNEEGTQSSLHKLAEYLTTT